MDRRLLIDADRDLPELHLLARLPQLLGSVALSPVLQVGSRFPWLSEPRLRASWTYPEHVLVAYAEGQRSRGAPLEVALDRYGLGRGIENIETLYTRLRRNIRAEAVTETGTGSYALFLSGLLEDLGELFGKIDRVYLMLPGLLPPGAESKLLEETRGRLPGAVRELVGVYDRGAAECEECLFLQRDFHRPGAGYRGVLRGRETTLFRGTAPFWCEGELRGRLDGGGEAAYRWNRLDEAIEAVWTTVRRGEELQAQLLTGAAAGDPTPLTEIYLLRRDLTDAVEELRRRVEVLRELLPTLTAHPELLLVPATAAERAAGRLSSELLPLGDPAGGAGFSSPQDKTPLDR